MTKQEPWTSKEGLLSFLKKQRPQSIPPYHWPSALLKKATNAKGYREAEAAMRTSYNHEVLRRVEYREFAKAVKQDSRISYETFLKNWPDGEFAPVATKRLEQLETEAWQEALKKNTIEAFEAYLREFPMGEYAKDARDRIEQIAGVEAWEAAKQKDTREAYKAYIERFPHGEHVQEARKRIEQITEEQAWKAARAQDTVKAYQGYISKFPQGKYVKNALKLIKQLKALAQERGQTRENPDARESGCSSCNDKAKRGKDKTNVLDDMLLALSIAMFFVLFVSLGRATDAIEIGLGHLPIMAAALTGLTMAVLIISILSAQMSGRTLISYSTFNVFTTGFVFSAIPSLAVYHIVPFRHIKANIGVSIFTFIVMFVLFKFVTTLLDKYGGKNVLVFAVVFLFSLIESVFVYISFLLVLCYTTGTDFLVLFWDYFHYAIFKPY